MTSAVGGRIREAMALAGFSANALAKVLEDRFGSRAPSRTTIGDYLAGNTSPSAATLLDIATVLRVRAGWLLSGEGERSQHLDLVRVLTPEVDQWLPESAKVRVREEAELCGYMNAPSTGDFADLEEFAGKYSAGAMYMAFWLEEVVGLAAASVGRRNLTAADVAAIAAREGLSLSFADAILHLCAAHRNLVLSLQDEPVSPRPSVAPSVVKPHQKAENGPKRPKSKKG